MNCPACGSAYKIPEDMLDAQIECKSCKRVFVPRNASKRRIQGKSNATPFIMGGAILVLVVIVFVVSGMRGSGGDQQPTTKPVARKVETGINNPRVRDVQEWLTAVSDSNRFKLGTTSDIGALAKFLGIGLIDGTAEDREKAVVDALVSGDKAAFLRNCVVTSATIGESEAEASSGKVDAYLALKEPLAKDFAATTARYDVSFTFVDGRARVTGFEPTYQPEPKAPAKPRGERAVKHEIIGSAQDVQRDYNGQKETVREAELKPLPHLDDTPEALRKEIDDNIALLIDIDASGATSNRANLKLKQTGKPAVPRLLNKLYELLTGDQKSLEDQHTVLQLRRVTMALEDLTGQRFGFNPSAVGNNATANQEYRLSSLKQWYGWWADNHWRKDFDYAIDKDEDPLAPTKSGDDGSKK